MLGCDIDPCSLRSFERTAGQGESLHELHRSKITCDITLLYPGAVRIGFRAGCMALNPPFSLQWDSTRLAPLGQSRLPSVAAAFQQAGGRGAGLTIDATLATALIALDLLTDNGAAFLIANEATLQRLIFDAFAPGNAIVKHIWRHDVFPGNPIDGPRPLPSSV